MTARKLRIIRGAAAVIAFIPGGLTGAAVGWAFGVWRPLNVVGLFAVAVLTIGGVGSHFEQKHFWFRLYPQQMRWVDSWKVGPGLFAPATMGAASGFGLGLAVMANLVQPHPGSPL